MAGECRDKTLAELVELYRETVNPAERPDEVFQHYSIPAYDADQRPTIERGSEIGSIKFAVQGEAILVSKLNPRFPRIWHVKPDERLPAIASTEFLVLKARQGTDMHFIKYLFLSPIVRTELQARATGTSGSHQRVKSRDVLDIRVPLPPLPEQRAIAHILGTLDDKIELNRRMSETLEAMARALFKAWFVDFDPVRAKRRGDPGGRPRWQRGQSLPGLPAHLYDLFPDRLVDSDLGPIPEGWKVVSVYEVADVIYGAPFSSAQFNTEGVGEPLLRIRDLPSESPGVWTTEVHPKGYKVRPGDIVVGMDGEFRAYLWGGVEAWLNQRLCVFKPKPHSSSAFVRNAIIQPLAEVEATETATTVIHLGKADIDQFRVVLPTPDVAGHFNTVCQRWYDRIVTSKQQSRTLATLRDALLPRLIRGEIRVKDAERFLKELVL